MSKTLVQLTLWWRDSLSEDVLDGSMPDMLEHTRSARSRWRPTNHPHDLALARQMFSSKVYCWFRCWTSTTLRHRRSAGFGLLVATAIALAPWCNSERHSNLIALSMHQQQRLNPTDAVLLQLFNPESSGQTASLIDRSLNQQVPRQPLLLLACRLRRFRAWSRPTTL